MSYQPIQQETQMAEAKEIELGDGSETDIEGHPADSEASLFLAWKRRNLISDPAQGLYKKMMQANVPVIVSLHFLVFNIILSIALGSLLFKFSSSSPGVKADSKLAPGELLYSYSEGFIPSPYQGWPTDENDELWRKYEDGNHIRITKEEADQLLYPTEHVPMEEYKDEYLVGLVIFHHLHCLSALRRAIYPKRYDSSLYDEDGNVKYEDWHHVDHCIEILRTYLECHPETTAMPMQWVPESSMAVYTVTQHTCRNFDVISSWAYDRTVNVPIRAHLENGRVVDYTGKPYGREYNETWLLEEPEGWAYTKDDM
ncbi:hypothetical protein M406DRAFT_348851 [Cryphonectria parasitica EP155]|uniref:Uncharacterized protein n=1 Tax=Cryphonectria parasitica (strain ATCC 38755 / EP155) TaxID=660469 RepID=A0A9P4YB02_CRYP1|nr:uncharacterized protein M406DRAFT_348851 [Cryphonectria parasitica EP155]KAF3769721.1 hypothetical protein M406DRAFT_348851 [Cryphonectria parasitica EP155]